YATGDESNLDSITPSFILTPSILSGGRQIVFAAGQVNDFDNDANNEYVVIEFNALVNNFDGAAVNHAGDTLSSRFQLSIGGVPCGDCTGGADLSVVEPSITNTTKTATLTTINGQRGVH